MEYNEALSLYERIDQIDVKISRILKRRIPHANMERGKADRRGDTLNALKWQNEAERLRLLMADLIDQQSKVRERLSMGGYVPR